MVLPELNSHLLSEWGIFFPGKEKPKKIHYLGIPGSIEGGTTTFLGFGEKSSHPLCAVKIHREKSLNDKTAHEVNVLNLIEKLGGPLSDTTPKIILGGKISGHWVTVQSILEGAPMSAPISEEGFPDIVTAKNNFEFVSKFLVTLQERTLSKFTIDASALISRGKKTIQDFSDIFKLSQTELKFLKHLENKLGHLAAQGHYIQHGDFCRQNILITENNLNKPPHIIDWTDSKLGGFPLHDFLFFITSYCLQNRRHVGISGFTEIFTYTFLSNNDYSKMVKQALVTYCHQMGIDLNDVPLLLGILLINQSLFEFHKMTRALNQGELPRFTLYLASLKSGNFDEAAQEQLWIYFFRDFIANHKNFLFEFEINSEEL